MPLKEPTPIRDRRHDARLVTRRIFIAAALCVISVVVLMTQLVRLQVVDHHHYVTLSQENRVKVVPVPPTRGIIYDRNGIVLAENRPSHRLVVTPERVPDITSALTEIAKIIDLPDAKRERFEDLLRRKRHFEEIPLRTRLDEEEVARLAAHRHRFPGMEVRAQLVRHYPLHEHASHAVGYVGRISPNELRRIETSRYRGTSHIGKGGVELAYEDILHGDVGYERVETNALGRVIRTLERQPPRPGDDLVLTIDSRLQEVAERALGDRRGAAIAMDPRNGEILAMASTPNYDPNIFVDGMSRAQFQELERGAWQPLFNRAVRGRYPPASTIKPFIGLAALDRGIITADETIRCTGEYFLDGIERPYRCWRPGGHGNVDLAAAVAQSSNVYFYEIGFELGIDAMGEFLRPFGFGETTGIDLVGERAGVLPSRKWKRTNLGEGWFHGETVITAIGLGYFVTTPLQLVTATSVFATRGERVQPQLVRAVQDGSTGEERFLGNTSPHPRIELEDPEHWESTIKAMRDSVRHPRGTARIISHGLRYDLVGKTGTAQLTTLGEERDYEHDERPEHLRDHAIFIAFAPADAPEIAVAVVIEHGGSGGAAAAPVARAITDAWLRDDTSYLMTLEAGRIDTRRAEEIIETPIGVLP